MIVKHIFRIYRFSIMPLLAYLAGMGMTMIIR
jgi:hypothetical protein